MLDACPFFKEVIILTGVLKTKTTSSGRTYYYIRLSYKDPRSMKWKTKEIATKLETKNNKRKAEAILKAKLEEYSYLENLPPEGTYDCDPDVLLCDYLDYGSAIKNVN